MNLTASTRPGELDCCRARLTSEPAAAAGACSRRAARACSRAVAAVSRAAVAFVINR